MQAKVSKGLATWAGIVAALGQYAAAVAVFLNDPDKAVALGPLTTATVTLVAVIYGRMSQAKVIASRPIPALGVTSSGLATAYANTMAQMGVAGTTPRPWAETDVQAEPRGAKVLDFDGGEGDTTGCGPAQP